MKKISGNLTYDIAIAIEKHEETSPIAKKVVEMINKGPKELELIHIYIGTIEALFTTIKTLEAENIKLKEAMTHPLVLNALIADKEKENLQD